MISRATLAVTGPRGRLAVIAAWVVLTATCFSLYTKLDDVTAAGQASFLPADAESTRALDSLEDNFRGGDDVPALIVFGRDSGLTDSDRKTIAAIGSKLDQLDLPGATQVLDPLSAGGGSALPGERGLVTSKHAAIIAFGIDADDRDAVTDDVNRVQDILDETAPAGLQAYVTGPAGVAADLQDVADEAGQTLLFVTLGLVLVLLLAVYRAPSLALLPLAVVGAAYILASALAYLLIEAGAIKVNSEGTMLLLVLIFGAGTDYSLLILHRYREQLAAAGDPRNALVRAVTESGPSILASGGTVIGALLVLLVADLESTRWLGPVLALGIASMLAATFTLLPALLSLLGHRAFWPARDFGAPPGTGSWRRLAELIGSRSRILIAAAIAFLAVGALGNLIHTETIGFGQGITRPTDSSRGTEILDANFPPGLSAPATVVTSTATAGQSLRALDGLSGVESALPAGASQNGELALIAVILNEDPYSAQALDTVEEMRSTLGPIDPGALVGGITAEDLDVEETNSRDTRLIVPLILVVVGVILMALLRALVAPLYLIATVIASFAATLGISTVLFTQFLGEDGLTFNLILISFMFLVALGVDYNIFLMHRARRETLAHGAREGILRALISTGGVVTGAGVILAGTFGTLTLLPLEALIQIGGMVALGVLLDTFLVRAVLVPAITHQLGERAWWPGDRHALGADTPESGG